MTTDIQNSPSAADGASPAPVTPSRRGLVLALVFGAAAICAILYAWKLPPFSSATQRTENAYVRGLVTVISPQVSGYVTDVRVKDFQQVRAGEPLFRIDERIYLQRVEQAKATLAAREADLANQTQAAASRDAALSAREAEVGAADAQLARARADMDRVGPLAADGSLSRREADAALASLRSAEASLRQTQAARKAAQQDIRAVAVSREGLQAAVDNARATLRLAQIDLDNTLLNAPTAGQLGQVGARRGQFVNAGTQLVSLVPPERWIIANFKERQAGKMAIGQAASVTVDALGDRRFTGRVKQLSPATGSEFALLPAQNATGNFTKVAQRIPVEIVLDPNQEGLDRLRPGMSVVARVDTASKANSRMAGR
ncbi:HlyD family secretion protein [Phenylobacterium sp.]|uniref:HlyD family secretion protein n=1 Tax=Phenylobacterium sp. TaxID=1871053 RepID=UPI0028A1708E|nr:HlyD family secretion protein [Phenylobacterium sp.]